MKHYLIIISAIVMFSCSPVQQIVPLGVINTEGVIITAEDGSFMLRSGDKWTPPYQNDTYGLGFNEKNADVLNS